MTITLFAARLSVVVFAMTMAIGANASASETQVILLGSQTAAQGELEDLARIADDEGLTLATAEARYGWQNSVAIAATAIESEFPASYAGTEVVSLEPAVAEIRFKGKVPLGAAPMVRGVPTGVELRLLGGEKMSQREVSAFVASVHSTALAENLTTALTTEYVRSSDVAVLTASPALQQNALSGERVSSETAGVASQIASALNEAGWDNVSVSTVETMAGEDESRYGGGRLEGSGGSTLACTAGFNVVNSAGTSGVATAGHCSNTLTHENVSGQSEYSVSYLKGHLGTYGDFQWGNTSDSEPDDFYYNAGVTRDVSGVASPVVNQYLCRYGHATGAQCAEVENNNICSTTSSGTACNLTRMKNDEASTGDSGGPWYYGNTAYGYHKGSVSTILGSRDVFSKATLIDEALGVRVRTS